MAKKYEGFLKTLSVIPGVREGEPLTCKIGSKVLQLRVFLLLSAHFSDASFPYRAVMTSHPANVLKQLKVAVSDPDICSSPP